MPISNPMEHDLAAIGITVFERGWLSSNNILIRDAQHATLVDSGYVTHAPQTIQLVAHALGSQPLDWLLNTHLHSDHCGGNAALQARYPALQTRIPPGQADAVARWDSAALGYPLLGQECPRFQACDWLIPGSEIPLGPLRWEVHAAQGHDPHAIVLFQRQHGVLISADALWQNGFGVVFPELDGVRAFDQVADTLRLITALAPTTVIPGHGPVFQDTGTALERAWRRLDQFTSHPDKHERHAMKVLLKFRLLDWQRIDSDTLLAWARQTPYLARRLPQEPTEHKNWLSTLLDELERAGALQRESRFIVNI